MRIDNELFYKIRKVHRLTTTELAELLGYSQTYISAIDRGVEPVTDNVDNRLKIALDLDTLKLREIESIYEKFTLK